MNTMQQPKGTLYRWASTMNLKNIMLSKKASEAYRLVQKGKKQTKPKNIWFRNTYMLEKHKEMQRNVYQHSGHRVLLGKGNEFREGLLRYWSRPIKLDHMNTVHIY